MAESVPEPSRLVRTLGLGDATVVGLGAMLGAGVFAAFAPAARAAGNALLLGLAVAALLAMANALSSARLAAKYPESGGAYVYGRKRIGPLAGFVAGWGFVAGKTASCTAMALTFAQYVAGEGASPAQVKALAVAAVAGLTVLNGFGVKKSALVTRGIVSAVLGTLALVVVAAWFGGTASAARLWPLTGVGAGAVSGAGVDAAAVLEAAGFLFFAFAGYARLATLGEEVTEPRRTIPRAMAMALVAALVVYLIVGASALAAVDASVLAASNEPLAAVIEAGRFAGAVPVVRAGAALACLGVLLSLLVGVSRTVFAMAAGGDLPSWLGAVDPARRTPRRAELLVGAAVIAVVMVADTRGAIGFSSFCVLAYYAVANAAAWTLPGASPVARGAAGLGLAGCLLVAIALPAETVLAGAAVIALGIVLFIGGRLPPLKV